MKRDLAVELQAFELQAQALEADAFVRASQGDLSAQRLVAFVKRDPAGARRLFRTAAALAQRRTALATPGPERDEIMRQRPRRRDRPRCGAPTGQGGKPCVAAVVCFRGVDGRIVTGERCARHGGSGGDRATTAGHERAIDA